MWLRLGADEILNLDQVTSIKRIGDQTIEIRYLDPQASRMIQFENAQDCQVTFERVIENLITLQQAME